MHPHVYHSKIQLLLITFDLADASAKSGPFPLPDSKAHCEVLTVDQFAQHYCNATDWAAVGALGRSARDAEMISLVQTRWVRWSQLANGHRKALLKAFPVRAMVQTRFIRTADVEEIVAAAARGAPPEALESPPNEPEVLPQDGVGSSTDAQLRQRVPGSLPDHAVDDTLAPGMPAPLEPAGPPPGLGPAGAPLCGFACCLPPPPPPPGIAGNGGGGRSWLACLTMGMCGLGPAICRSGARHPHKGHMMGRVTGGPTRTQAIVRCHVQPLVLHLFARTVHLQVILRAMRRGQRVRSNTPPSPFLLCAERAARQTNL